jgi:putative transposase
MTLAGRIEEIYLKYPFYGSRRIARELSRDGSPVNRKRVHWRNTLISTISSGIGLQNSR